MITFRNEEGAGRRDQKVPASPLQCSPFLPGVVTEVRKFLDEVHVDLPVVILERRDVQHLLASVDEPVVETRRLEIASSSEKLIGANHLLKQLYEGLTILWSAFCKAQHLESSAVLCGDLIELYADRVRQRQLPEEYRHCAENRAGVFPQGLLRVTQSNSQEASVTQLRSERRNVTSQVA